METWGSRIPAMICVTAALVRCGSFEADPAQGLADAAADAPATDAPPPPTDGAPTGDCKNDALHLCDTFDDRAQAFAPSLWTRDEGGGAGALSSPARSAPNALAVEIADASLGHYFLVRRFADVRSVTCSFAMMIDGPQGSDFAVPFIVQRGPQAHRLRVPRGGAASLELASGGGSRETPLAALQPKAWHTVELTIPEVTTLRVDGREFATSLSSAGVVGELLVSFGLQTNNGTTGWTARIDDVRCTATP